MDFYIPYVKVFPDLLDALEPLGDAEKGRLFTAVLVYAQTGEAPQLNGNERFLFPMLKGQIDRDVRNLRDQSLSTSNARADAGRKGAAARWNGGASEPMAKMANGGKNGKCHKAMAKMANDGKNGYKDKDEDKDKDKDEDKDEDSLLVPDGTSTRARRAEPDSSPTQPAQKGTKQQEPEISDKSKQIFASFSPDLKAVVRDWYEYKRQRKEKYTSIGANKLITQIGNAAAQYGSDAVIATINASMSSGYKGIVWDRLAQRKGVSADNVFLDLLREDADGS